MNPLVRYVRIHRALIAERLELEARLAAIDKAVGGNGPATETVAPQASRVTRRKRRGLSAVGRAKIAAAQRARWAELKAVAPAAKVAKRSKPKMSTAGRARIAAA
jgi:hypothetical protein